MNTPISAIQQLGKIGLPLPVSEMAARAWDAIIVGAGHNGLTCAAYLARAGKKVLVLEARERIGGACTLEEPWPGYIVSPCAYLTGLLHPLVIRELNLPAYGFEWMPAAAGMFVPFEDGSSIQLWDDDARCEAEIERFAPHDLAGWRAMSAVTRRTREALRPDSEADLWLNPNPTRAEIEDRLHGDAEAYQLLFEWSMADYVENYLDDERLHLALLGQGVIGTNASPFDPGTASIAFHHSSGRMEGRPGMWGYVKGGTGMVSFILADIAREAGAVVAAGTPVAAILPGRGVQLTGGERIEAPVVISNADPQVTRRLLGDQVDSGWQAQVEATPIEGCTVKLSVGLHELPNFTARPGPNERHHTAQINTPLSKQEWRDSYALARQGQIAPRLWTELYFQSAQDRSVVPAGKHVMSAFCQYVPYQFAEGDWDSRRDEVEQIVINSIGRFCSNLPEAIEHVDVMGPPDIERKVGLTGGHIFQGSCLPAHMWDRRLPARTPMAGVYLCGAATHPGGSVIAVNGRNAAMQVLHDTAD